MEARHCQCDAQNRSGPQEMLLRACTALHWKESSLSLAEYALVGIRALLQDGAIEPLPGTPEAWPNREPSQTLPFYALDALLSQENQTKKSPHYWWPN